MALSDEEIDRIERGELGVGPSVGEHLIAQAREANRLRAEVFELKSALIVAGRPSFHEAMKGVRFYTDEMGRLREALKEACEIADVAFRTDYGFNYEASIAPRDRIAQLRKLAEG